MVSRVWEKIGVEVVVRVGKRLSAAEMFRMMQELTLEVLKGLERSDGTYKCHTTRLAKQIKVAGTFGNGGTLYVNEAEVRD